MGGKLSNTQNNETEDAPIGENNANTRHANLMDSWRKEVVQRVTKYQNPQNRQLNYERNKRVCDSIQNEMCKNENKTLSTFYTDSFSNTFE